MDSYATRTWGKPADETQVLDPYIVALLYGDDIPDRAIIGPVCPKNVRLSITRQLERRCTRCQEWLPADFNHFRYHPKSWNNLNPICHQCERAKAREQSIKRQLRPAALAYFGGCAYCGNPPGLLRQTRITMDHFIAESDPKSPGTVATNLVPCCGSCNSSKHTADPYKWTWWRFGPQKSRQTLDRIEAYFAQIGK